jgi:hypothetical protein
VLSIFTSKGDWATHYFFPLYRFFSTFFDANRSKMQRSANYETVGWFKRFVTHELIYKPDALPPSTQASGADTAAGQQALPDASTMAKSYHNIQTQRKYWESSAPPPAGYYTFDQSILEPVDGFHPRNPFLVVSVDKQIMKDHTDIADPVLVNFIREYIQFCQAKPEDRTK